MNGWMRTVSLAASLLTATAAANAQAPDPAVQPVQSFYGTLLDTMKQAKQLGVKGRYEKLKPAIEQSFDLPGMARLSVGPPWNKMTPQDRQALADAFGRYTIASYASNFDGYGGEKFEVDPTPQQAGADKRVSSKLVTSNETIPFIYRMRQVGGQWKIIDVYLNGYVSQIAKQRSDFGATVQSGGAAALEKKLSALTDKLMK